MPKEEAISALTRHKLKRRDQKKTTTEKRGRK